MIIILIVDSSKPIDVGIFVGARSEPIIYTVGNQAYAIEYTHLIEGALFGAIHNISHEPLFVEGVYIKIFNKGRQINSFFLEEPLTIKPNSYGYFNTTAPEQDFNFCVIGLVLQRAT